jgi:hypothetical protein
MTWLLSSPDLLAQIVGLVLVIILPLIPAALLYLFIPGNVSEGTTDPKKSPDGTPADLGAAVDPFHGLKIKVKGAFGGYLITAVLAFSVFCFITLNSLKQVTSLKVENTALTEKNKKLNEELDVQRKQSTENPREVWTVHGYVDLDLNEKSLSLSYITVSVRPPVDIGPTGYYEFPVIMPKYTNATVYPIITFTMEGYRSDEVPLRPDGELKKEYDRAAAAGDHSLQLRPALLRAKLRPTPAPSKIVPNPKTVHP